MFLFKICVFLQLKNLDSSSHDSPPSCGLFTGRISLYIPASFIPKSPPLHKTNGFKIYIFYIHASEKMHFACSVSLSNL